MEQKLYETLGKKSIQIIGRCVNTLQDDMQQLEDAVLELEDELEKLCKAEELLEQAVIRR